MCLWWWFKFGYRKFFLIVFFTLFFLPNIVSAFEPFIISDIQIEGISRVSKTTVLDQFSIKTGDLFSESDATKGVHLLYKTGYFESIEVKITENKILLSIRENPIIESVDFIGIKNVNIQDINDLFQKIGFNEGFIFNEFKLKQAENIIKDKYIKNGNVNTKINPIKSLMKDNRIRIKFDIEEGHIPKIVQIRLTGCKSFQEKKLLRLFHFQESNFLRLGSNSNKFSLEKFQVNMDRLRSYYMSRGYLEYFANPNFSFSSDFKKVKIFININEGKIYQIRNVKITGNLLHLNVEKIKQLVCIQSGDLFNGQKISSSIDAIMDYLGRAGYAFANIECSKSLQHDTCEADIIFHIDPGYKIYIDKIQINGNFRTRDQVIRRAICQQEASLYNLKNIRISHSRIARLGFFSKVDVETKLLPNTLDRVNLSFKVQEKSTGIMNLGIGYGSSEKAVFSASISEENMLGTGKRLNLNLNTSKSNQTFLFSHTDSDVFQTNNNLTISTKYKVTDPWNNTNGDFQLKTVGFGMTYGVPISEYAQISLGGTLEKNKVSLNENTPLNYSSFVNQYGETTKNLTANLSWLCDKRDSALIPTKGYFGHIRADLSTIDLKYYTISANCQYYLKLATAWTLMLNAIADHGSSYSKKSYPVIKNIYASGIASVRGYDEGSLGLKDPKTGNYLGGSSRIVANLQLYFPFLTKKEENNNMRWFLFGDVGRIYGKNPLESLSFSPEKNHLCSLGWRLSAGIGLNWRSFLGPIQLSYGFPLNKQEGDKIQNFQFQIGTNF